MALTIRTYTELLIEVEELRTELECTNREQQIKVLEAVGFLRRALEPVLGFDTGYDPPEIDEVRRALRDLIDLVEE